LPSRSSLSPRSSVNPSRLLSVPRDCGLI
jgi:hypothetical protein